MNKNKKNIIILLIKIVSVILIVFISYRYLFGFYIVKTDKYKVINITPSDFLIYYKIYNEIHNNNIVLYNNKLYRVIGTYGQVINKKNNKFFIDDNIIDGVSYEFTYPYTINKNEIFLYSYEDDSRTIGCVDANKIQGILLFRMQIRDF